MEQLTAATGHEKQLSIRLETEGKHQNARDLLVSLRFYRWFDLKYVPGTADYTACVHAQSTIVVHNSASHVGDVADEPVA